MSDDINFMDDLNNESGIVRTNQLGRPSLLTEEMVEKARIYMGGAYQQPPCNDVIPMIQGLSCYLGVSERTVNRWVADGQKEYNENKDLFDNNDLEGSLHYRFCRAAWDLKTMQFRALVNGGLSGLFAAPITALMLGHNHNVAKLSDNRHGGNLDAPPIVVKSELTQGDIEAELERRGLPVSIYDTSRA